MEKPFESNASGMGRESDPEWKFQSPVYLQRVPMVDGDYDAGGAYWGKGTTPLYCVWDKEGHVRYFRAKSIKDAKRQLPSEWNYIENSKWGRAENTFSPYLEEMCQQYMETALWASTDDNDVPLDTHYQVADIAKDTQKRMRVDCHKFFVENQGLLEEAGWPADQAGHDFFLTRNRHGTGFWDRDDYPDDIRQGLTKAAQRFGETYLHVYRGKIHQD